MNGGEGDWGRIPERKGEIPEKSGGRPGQSLCSRNAHAQKVLVRRAHDGTDPGHLEAHLTLGGRGETSELGGSI